MVDNYSEWHRVVAIDPDDQAIVKRKASRAAFHEILVGNGAIEKDLLLAASSLAICDFAGVAEEDRLFTETVKTLVDAQPSFPQLKSQNALEVRVFAAATLDNLLRSSDSDESMTDNAKLLIASALVAATRIRKPGKEKRLAPMLDGMVSVASTLLHDRAMYVRQREPISVDFRTITAAADVPTMIKGLVPELEDLVDLFNAQIKVDREEIDMLWFTISGFSKLANKRFADLSTENAAALCALEITSNITFPVLPSVESLIGSVLSRERKTTELAERKLSDYVESWDDDTWTMLATHLDGESQLAKQFPTLLPLSWLVSRHRESGGAMEWQKEFVAKTQMTQNTMLSPSALARQLLDELTVIYFYKSDESED